MQRNLLRRTYNDEPSEGKLTKVAKMKYLVMAPQYRGSTMKYFVFDETCKIQGNKLSAASAVYKFSPVNSSTSNQTERKRVGRLAITFRAMGKKSKRHTVKKSEHQKSNGKMTNLTLQMRFTYVAYNNVVETHLNIFLQKYWK